MSRELRKVPATWQHPKNDKGAFIALFDNFNQERIAWEEGKRQWDAGYIEARDSSDEHRSWEPKPEGLDGDFTYEDWVGKAPSEAAYIPDWPLAERTHLQMYETITEGTPISPVVADEETLARWLADNPDANGGVALTEFQWLCIINAQLGKPAP